MAESALRILQISTTDISGGAERVAWNLFQSYRARGHGSWLAVGHKHSDDADVLLIPDHELHSGWCRFWKGVHSRLQSLNGQGVHGTWRLSCLALGLADPGKWLDEYRGVEDFRFPGTSQLLSLPPQKPDIIHCHNLHGGYFDLRVLPRLSQQVPVILTLHDAWLLSGHCAHSFDCNRWKTGCGRCPDLKIYPAIKRDATAHNWRRKRGIFAQARLYVTTPSRWLMRKVEESILASAIVEARVIPNGLDLTVFRPEDRYWARSRLGIPQNTNVLLFVGNRTRGNPWKDYPTLETAVKSAAERLFNRRLILICLGERREAERLGQAEAWFIDYQKDPETIAQYYRAADIYAHASRADTFPNTVLEALACGTPVVATAVGGIAEQVKALEIPNCGSQISGLKRYGMDTATGVLVPPGDAEGMAVGIERLLKNDSLRRRMGENAARDASERFSLLRQACDYLDWYKELVDSQTRKILFRERQLG